MTTFVLQQLVNALTIGALYALIALGYTMVYGVLKLINFAHGEMFTGGAYIALLFIFLIAGAHFQPNLALAAFIFLASFVLIGVLGVVIEKVAYRPLRTAPRLAPLLSALGVSIVLQQVIMVVAGPEPFAFPDILHRHLITLGPVTFTNVNLIVLGVCCALMIGLHQFIMQTDLGIRVRAIAENMQTARLVGIDVEMPIAIIFFAGPALGAVAGVLYAMNYGVIHYGIGAVIGLKAFIAAILGGIGSIPGAVLGGFLLGFLETFGAGLLPILTGDLIGSEYRDIFAFLILVVVLLVRPGGILGRPYTEEDQVYKKDF